MKFNILKLCAGLILLAGMLSCDDGLSTLFATIQNDTLISDSDLDNNISVLDMGLVTIGGTTDYYYIACGNLKRRLVSGGDWSNVSTGASGIVNTMATNGTLIYAGVVGDNAVGTIRYFDGTDWDVTPVALPVDFKQAVRIRYTSGQFYISYLKNDNTYSLATASGSEFGFSFSYPITDMIDADTYVNGTTVSINGATTPPNLGTTYNYSGIYYDGSYYYVSTREGTIHRTLDTSSWETRGSYSNGVNQKVWFTTFVQAQPGYLLVGTANYGFYVIDTDVVAVVPPFSVTHFSDSSKTALYNGAVESFYWNDATDTIFIGSMGKGLWRNTFSATAAWGDTWRLE